MSDTQAPQGAPGSEFFSNMPKAQRMEAMPGGPDELHQGHDLAVRNYNQLKKVFDRLDVVRKILQKLEDLADTVTEEDVIEAGAELMQHGVSGTQLASVLASMPLGGGEALAAWVAQQVSTVEENEKKLIPALAEARHQMGVSALHSIIGHHLVPPGEETPAGEAPAPTNPLIPPGA